MTTAAAPRGPLVRVRMLVAYDGTEFHGFAAQPGHAHRRPARSRRPSSGCCGTRSSSPCAGRTDSGVHAWGQVVPSTLPGRRSTSTACSGRCQAVRAGDRRCATVAAADARLRRPLLGPVPRATATRVVQPAPCPTRSCPPRLARARARSTSSSLRPGLRPVHRRARLLAPFCRRPKAPGGRRAGVARARGSSRAGWDDLGDGLLRFEIEATAFCHQMVRSIVGTLVAAGQGQRRAGRDPGHPRGPATGRRRTDRPAPGAVPVGGRLLSAEPLARVARMPSAP